MAGATYISNPPKTDDELMRILEAAYEKAR